LSDSEHDLQRAVYSSLNITKQFGMEISPITFKVMAFKGQVPVRSKIAMYNSVLKQINDFTQPRIQWVTGAFSLGVKRPGR
jgi:hypothetical protein